MEKAKSYIDSNNFRHNVEYVVSINLIPKWNDTEIRNFINENLSEIEIIEILGNQVKLLWPLEVFSGEEEIILEMYQMLDDGRLGTYSYERIS